MYKNVNINNTQIPFISQVSLIEVQVDLLLEIQLEVLALWILRQGVTKIMFLNTFGISYILQTRKIEKFHKV